ncbi:MAG TPA: methyltransferase domain-containing protein, partial [Candidatus Limnocylindria bacterium]|nr:methyltransferase domain-containing protein [Candidatus Limnocylindria bacterium]
MSRRAHEQVGEAPGMTGNDARDRWTRLEELVPPYPAALFDVLERVVALPASPTVVDVGAGTGRAALPMAARGWHVTAVDTDDEA